MFSNILKGFSHLFFPHNCLGCATDNLLNNELLCAKCLHELPETLFFNNAENPVEKIFYGRLKIECAASGFYFTKNSLLQHLMIQLKYRGHKEAGEYLGKLIGYQIQNSLRFKDIDAIIPLPLNSKKEFIRGYNQAYLISQGIEQIISKSIFKDAVERIQFTETQTHENRVNRWRNMEGVFKILDSSILENKHILLVDDIVTTGATLEACGSEILKLSGTKLSIATVAYTL